MVDPTIGRPSYVNEIDASAICSTAPGGSGRLFKFPSPALRRAAWARTAWAAGDVRRPSAHTARAGRQRPHASQCTALHAPNWQSPHAIPLRQTSTRSLCHLATRIGLHDVTARRSLGQRRVSERSVRTRHDSWPPGVAQGAGVARRKGADGHTKTLRPRTGRWVVRLLVPRVVRSAGRGRIEDCRPPRPSASASLPESLGGDDDVAPSGSRSAEGRRRAGSSYDTSTALRAAHEVFA